MEPTIRRPRTRKMRARYEKRGYASSAASRRRPMRSGSRVVTVQRMKTAAIASSSEMISPASKVFLEPALKSADGVFITIAVSSIAVKVRCGRDIDSF